MRVLWFTLQWPTTFRALRHRNFQLFWSGQLISLIGTWMQSAAQGWLVYQLVSAQYGEAYTALMVTRISILGSLPIFVFSLLAGVLADRFDKRKIVIATQISAMILAFGLATLVGMGIVRLWHVAVFAVLTGVVASFDMPTRQAYVVDMVGQEDLLNAIALNSSIFNGARIVGPLVAGILIGIKSIGIPGLFHVPFGMSGIFYLNGISYIAVIISLLMIRTGPSHGQVIIGSLWEHLGEGFRYVFGHAVIRLIMIVMAVLSILGFSYASLVNVMAGQVLMIGSKGYGLLLSATGIGALIGALILATLAGRVRKGRVLLMSSLLFSTGLIGFGASKHVIIAVLMLVLVGGGLVMGSASINSLIQEIVPDQLRGRVVSMWTFIFAGLMPIGFFYIGQLAHATSVPIAIMLSGAFTIVFLIFITIARPWVWQLE